jgi:predicted DNA-binding protein YlxM (UPF0122 family)
MRGRGGKRALTAEQEAEVIELYTESNVPVSEIASAYEVCRKTIYNVLARARTTRKEKAPDSSTVAGH